MTIVLTGAGSGGHITPLLAVAHELKRLKPGAKIIYVGQRGDSLIDVPKADPDIDAVYAVAGGKFRRYHGKGLKQLMDVPMVVRNTRDMARVVQGFSQSRRLLKKIKADVVFIKGGILGVPIGLAAASLKIPFLTHDSDALPGLGHRIIAKRAKLHAVALPEEAYANYYPADKTKSVGVPIADSYQLVGDTQKAAYKKELGLEKYDKIVFVTGGGNGAKRLNENVAEALPGLLRRYSNLCVVHATGRLHEQAINEFYDTTLTDASLRERVLVRGFIEDLYRYSGAADLIITRAGATNLAEFATQGKACIIVPNPDLTGGHQLKNAQLLANKQAARIVSEEDLGQNPKLLGQAIDELLNSEELRQKLGQNFHAFAKPDAAKKLAQLILKIAEKS